MSQEPQRTGVKINQKPGGQSSWSMGWKDEPQQPTSNKNLNYRNESKIVLGQSEEPVMKGSKKNINSPPPAVNLPSYDPRNGGKSTLSFGNDATDYRKKDQVYVNMKKPVSRGNIQ